MKQPNAFFPEGTSEDYWKYREGDRVFLTTDPDRITYTILHIAHTHAVVLEKEGGEQVIIQAKQAWDIVPERLAARYDLEKQKEANE